ncbi:MAG: hypothetical protein JWP91_1355 [Fibrobacteres bacterium]|nr:hypothetical protein [Fibrobacterota bacterium]
MRNLSTAIALTALIAGAARLPLRAQTYKTGSAGQPALAGTAVTESDTATLYGEPAPVRLQQPTRLTQSTGLEDGGKDYNRAEKDLDATSRESASSAAGEEAVIETSHPYLLPRLFTLPTAYSLKSYEVRFGGQGNIHNTFANMNTEAMKASVSMGFGGIMELGYQLDEYYTVQDISDKILMGYFKLSLLNESKYLPAAAISASKNLRNTFRAEKSYTYTMKEDMYEVVLSKGFRIGDNRITVHPGAQIIRDEVTGIAGQPELGKSLQITKFNPRLGLSWQTRPKTMFMYEFKLLHPTDVASLGAGGIETNEAMENNLGIRYYIRNWLCIDSGIRHYYDFEKKDDEMKLHANFVGVIPMATVYDRVQNYFKK